MRRPVGSPGYAVPWLKPLNRCPVREEASFDGESKLCTRSEGRKSFRISVEGVWLVRWLVTSCEHLSTKAPEIIALVPTRYDERAAWVFNMLQA